MNDSPNDTRSTGIRRLLRGLGGATALGLAGCLGDGDGDDDGGDDGNGNGGNGNGGNGNGGNGNGGNGNGGNGNGDNSHPSDWHRDHDWETDAVAANNWDNYTVTELEPIDNMMAIDVAPDGRVFYVTRGGYTTTPSDHGSAKVGYVDPDSGDHRVVLELDVRIQHEEGGQGVALDPEFEENGWVYVYYCPAEWDADTHENPYNPEIDFSYMHVSRFELSGEEIDPDSETEVIRIPYQRDTCCHLGGYLEFGPEGYLYVSTGDNTYNQNFDLYPWTVNDEREGHELSDAQRTSGNSADLRGSILRIVPEDDGGYSIPDGNLYSGEAYGAEVEEGLVKPEIYVQGLRNPFVISVDEHTGHLFVADYGNDAGAWDPVRGPVGMAEYRMVCGPQNAGWPFFRGYYPTRRYDFENEEPGQPYWPDNPRNTSPNNTGIEELPPITPADVWQPQNHSSYVDDAEAWLDMPRPGELSWPELPQGGSANAGPTYRYSEDFGDGALDPYFDGKQFVTAPYTSEAWVGYFTYQEDGRIEIDDFLPTYDFISPTDMVYGPDGRLFLMDYGQFEGSDGALYMIEYDR